MSKTVIKVEGVSKQYRLGELGTGSLSQDLQRSWARFRGHEDPTLRIDQKQVTKGSLVWSLKDINFEIGQGDTVGIIGKNGAGKSTLLKILSRITAPTTGSLRVRGRVASLLEVGTGFHPELSGRDNIFLNGAILGMSKSEIKRKFDEIVDFSGVGQYIDTPVKRYSSGMYVRLAFAVAAHLESEILIVDEVLAVGDAEFQKKCLGKMGDVSQKEGRTVLFVSHDIRAIKSLCKEAIFLKQGYTIGKENLHSAIAKYYTTKNTLDVVYPIILDELIVHDFTFTQDDLILEEFDSSKEIKITIDYELTKPLNNFRFGIFIKSSVGDLISASLIGDWRPEFENQKTGKHTIIGHIPANIFLSATYQIEIHASIHGVKNFMAEEHASQKITIKSPPNYNVNHLNEPSIGYVITNLNWNINNHSLL